MRISPKPKETQKNKKTKQSIHAKVRDCAHKIQSKIRLAKVGWHVGLDLIGHAF